MKFNKNTAADGDEHCFVLIILIILTQVLKPVAQIKQKNKCVQVTVKK